MPRWRTTKPTTQVIERMPALPSATLPQRRARAFDRVWPLLSTSIPTADILASYLDELDHR